MKKYYIAYIGNTIWGVGGTAQEARRDAVVPIAAYNLRCPKKDVVKRGLLKTYPATKLLVTAVEELGGADLRWILHWNVADLDCRLSAKNIGRRGVSRHG